MTNKQQKQRKLKLVLQTQPTEANVWSTSFSLLLLVATTHEMILAVLGLGFWFLWAPSSAQASSSNDIVHSVRFQPFTASERLNGLSKKPQLLGDRFEYWDDDRNGQFYCVLPESTEGKLRIVIRGTNGTVAEHEATKPSNPKLHFLVRTDRLKPGEYTAELGALKCAFTRVAKRRETAKFPATGVPILLHQQSALANVDWPVRGGVPLPPNAVTSADQLALYENGRRIPAQITTRATWSPDGPPKWVHVHFVGKYRNGKPANYRLKRLPSSQVPSTSRPLPQRGEEEVPSLVRSETSSPLGGEGRVRGGFCEQTDDKIVVDTGVVRFEISRKKFAGIERAWATWEAVSDGRPKTQTKPSRSPVGDGLPHWNKIIDGQGGPYVVDERGIRWESKFDDKIEVIVEEQNEARVVILARGWLKNPDAKAEPLCPFQTRIIAHRGSPLIRFQHHVIIGFDATAHQLANVGFQFAAPRSEEFRLGVDGKTIAGGLAEKQTVFLHQDRFDHLRIVEHGKALIEGQRSDGWFAIQNSTASPSPLSSPPEGRGKPSATSGDGAVSTPPPAPKAFGVGGEGRVRGAVLALLLRDVWQKFPKEVEMSTSGMTLHLWPAHGHRAFSVEDELKEQNIYKWWCFHQGQLLDLKLPQNYFDALKKMPGTFENTPEIAQAGNAMGAVIANEFALLFLPDEKAKDVPGWAKLLQEDPVASAPAEWNAGTQALGPMAAVDRRNFPEIEDSVEKGFLSYTKCVERGNEYGMWNYADTHTYWNVKTNFAQLHRVWHNSHYHEAGKTWLLYFRGGSKDLLDWARASTDHYINIGTVNYAPPNDPRDDINRYLDAKPVIVDGKVQASEQHWWLFRTHDPEQAPWYKYLDTIFNVPPDEQPLRHIRFIIPGAMYHCKGLTHWGKKDYPMDKGEAHAWIWGHWMDPDASLWNWYIDANPRAWDVYRMWHGSIRKYGLPRGGVGREMNTAIACAVSLYEATWDADLLPSIHGMAESLRTEEPLDKQWPGNMWHPQWINRYYHMARDPRYVPFIKEYASNRATTTALALPALGYEVSGDKSYLFPHFDGLRNWPNAFFHKPGDPYDWYGQGPGPIGSSWWYMTWGEFLYQMQRAGLTSFDAVPPKPGNYPGASSRFDDAKAKPSALIYIWQDKDGAIDLSFGARSLGGDLHPTSIAVFTPSGKLIHRVPRVPEKGGPSSWEGSYRVESDGETGMYRVEYRTFGTMTGPVSSLPNEAALLEPKTDYWAWRLHGCLLPLAESKPIQLTIRSESERSPLNFMVRDGKNKIIAQGSLFQPREFVSQTIQLDPSKHPLPWKIEATGRMAIQYDGSEAGLLLGSTPQAVRTIRGQLEKKSQP